MSTGYTLDGNEVIIRQIKKHWIALAPVVASAAMIFIVVIGISYLMAKYRSSVPAAVTPGLVGVLIAIMLIVAVFIVFAGVWVYRRNYILLTTKHLIRVEQRGLFSRSVSQLSLSRLQDVSSSRPGLLPTLLDFGTLTIQTAGEEDNFVFTQMPNPSEIADQCLVAHDKYADTLLDNISVGPQPATAASPAPVAPVASVAPAAPVAPEPTPPPMHEPVAPPAPPIVQPEHPSEPVYYPIEESDKQA